MSFVLYDIKTTGVRKAYDQILEFTAVRTDFELREIESFETQARLSPHIVPSPQALSVNQLDIADIASSKRPSLYRMVCHLRERLESWGACTFLGFNSLSFDEEFLRQAFYQCLFPPFLTNTPPNTRGDVLHLLRAFAAFHPDKIVVPSTAAEKRTFSLRLLSTANGFPHVAAHEAMADVRAMLHLCRLVADRAPDLWSRYQQFSQKRSVVDFIRDEPVFLYFDASWSATTRCVTCLGENPNQRNTYYCLSLTTDVDELAQLGPEALTQWLMESDGAIVRLKVNHAPVLCPMNEAPPHLTSESEMTEFLTRARRLSAVDGLSDRLLAACSAAERIYEPSAHVETQIYEQPFWPGVDEVRLQKFHQTPWEERRALMDGLKDKRSWQLARRIMFMERSDLLSKKEQQALSQGLRRRINDDEVGTPWLTVPAARRELAALRAKASPDALAQLLRLEGYLRSLID